MHTDKQTDEGKNVFVAVTDFNTSNPKAKL